MAKPFTGGGGGCMLLFLLLLLLLLLLFCCCIGGGNGCVTFVLRLQCDETAAIAGSISQCAYIDVYKSMQRL